MKWRIIAENKESRSVLATTETGEISTLTKAVRIDLDSKSQSKMAAIGSFLNHSEGGWIFVSKTPDIFNLQDVLK